MKIKVNSKKCTGCHLCELVCSLFHLGLMNTEKSAIRILKDDLDTSMNQPRICLQCKEMKCLEGEDVVEELETYSDEMVCRLCDFLPLFR